MAGFTEVERFVGELPFWYLVPEGGENAPLVIVQHGYSGSKETDLPIGRLYAEAGYRVAVTESLHHGNRGGDKRDEIFATDFETKFGQVVEQTVCEIRALIDAYSDKPVGMTGISMGGFITFLAASLDPRIAVACPLIGSPLLFWANALPEPEASRVSELNPLTHPERFTHCALLIQNGEADTVVPIGPARELHEKLAPIFAAHPERLKFIAYPDLGHEVPQVMHEANLAWMRQFLPLEG